MKSKITMKNLISMLAIFWLALVQTTNAQITVLAEQDFGGEFTEGWAFTPDPAPYLVGGDIWDTVQTLSDITPVTGSYFWGMQDLDNPNGGGSFWHTLSFAAVDVAGYANASVSFDYYTIGYDGTDSIAYVVEFDDGTTWGTPVTGESDTQAWTTVTVTIPPGTNWVRLRLQAFQNGGSDYAAFDNVKVFNNEAGDTTPPEVVDGGFYTTTNYFVAFSEAVTVATAENTANYVVTPGQTTQTAVLNATMDTVFGTVAPGLDYGVEYTVNISGVVDTSSNANEMVPFVGSFYFNDYNGSDLKITELYYGQPDDGVQDIDYLELYNGGSDPIQLGGLAIVEGIEMEFMGDIELAAGEFMVLCENLANFNTAFPGVTNVMQWDAGGLSGGGEDLIVENSIGEEVVFFEYDTSSPWPNYSDTVASELCDLMTDMNDGNNWRYASQVSSTTQRTLYGSPGAANLCVDAVLPTEVSTVAELRAGATDGTEYLLTGEAVLTFQQSFRNQKFVQDATAGILIDDNGGAITTTYVVGDGITNLVGTLSEFNGMLQFVPSGDPGAASSEGNEIVPVTVTLAEFNSNFNDYESEVIYITDVSFADAGGTFSNGSNYTINQAEEAGVFRTNFFNVDYIGTTIPSMANLTGLAIEFNGTSQIASRNAADIDEIVGMANVTFRVDLSQADGFDAGLGVNLMGINGNWSLGDAMDDSDMDLTYEVTLELAAGDYEFKFRNGNDDNVGGLEWEDLPGGGNRMVTVVGGVDTVLAAFCWGSTEPCSETPSNITFKVDVSQAGLDLTSGINLMGTATDWTDGTPMDDTDGDMVYELTLALNPNTYEYKFRTGDGTWESIGNRTLVVVEGEDQVLPAVCWDSNEPCPGPMITITAPADGSTVNTTDFTLEFTVENFMVGNPGDPDVEGHISWMLDDVDQGMKYDVNPVELTGLSEGMHEVIMMLVDNEDAGIGVADTVSFEVNTTITGGGMETFTNSSATNSYGDGSYVGDNGITWNFVASRDDNGDANGSGIDVPALMLRRVADASSVYSEPISGGIGSFSVKLYKGFTGGGDRQVEVFINDISIGTSEVFDDFDLHVFSVDNVNIAGDVVIRIDNITPKQVIVDDITWTGYEGAVMPIIAINAPTEGTTYQVADIPVEVVVQNFVVGTSDVPESQGHIMWMLDEMTPVMKYDTEPELLEGLENGPHTLIMTLVDNDDNLLDPSVADTVNFTIDVPTAVEVNTIAELRAGLQDGTVYQLTGEAVVTFTQSFRNQKFIQDETAAVLIDDNANVVTSFYVRGDGMTGIKGTLTEYGELLQFVPFEDPGEPTSSGNIVTPQTVTLAELNANLNDYESELVYVAELSFDDAGATFEGGSNYGIMQGDDAGIFRANFYGADYIGTAIPNMANLTALAIEFNGTTQIVSRDLMDIDVIDAIAEQEINEFMAFPNPSTGQFTISNQNANGEFLIEMITIEGKTVHNQLVNFTPGQSVEINAENLQPGMYFLKMSSTVGQSVQVIRTLIK